MADDRIDRELQRLCDAMDDKFLVATQAHVAMAWQKIGEPVLGHSIGQRDAARSLLDRCLLMDWGARGATPEEAQAALGFLDIARRGFFGGPMEALEAMPGRLSFEEDDPLVLMGDMRGAIDSLLYADESYRLLGLLLAKVDGRGGV